MLLATVPGITNAVELLGRAPTTCNSDLPSERNVATSLVDVISTRDLNIYLDHIWQRCFTDIPCVNEVHITYCQPWKTRLGLIRLSQDNKISFIGINSLLQHEDVPYYVLLTTVAHELTHYAHGFGSPLPRRYKHPHANNVVNRELARRGLGEYVQQCDEWIDKQWFPFYDSQRILKSPGHAEKSLDI